MSFYLDQFMAENDLCLSVFRSSRTSMWVATLEKPFALGLTQKVVNDKETDRSLTGPTVLGLFRRCSFYPVTWAVNIEKAIEFLEETCITYKDDKEKIASVVEETSIALQKYVAEEKNYDAFIKHVINLPAGVSQIPEKSIH